MKLRGRRAFSVQAPQLRKNLPLGIRLTSSLSSITSRLIFYNMAFNLIYSVFVCLSSVSMFAKDFINLCFKSAI